ncbi:MAG: hypothetical protein ACRYG8_37650 [Janthinobacterium lividum]
MATHSAFRFTLGLFDITALGGSLDIPSGNCSFCFPDDDDDGMPPWAAPDTAPVPAVNFRPVGDRGRAYSWKARAADNIAAIRLLQVIEAEDHAASPDEQVRLGRFICFGASELTIALFPLPGEDFALAGKRLARVCSPSPAIRNGPGSCARPNTRTMPRNISCRRSGRR